MTFEKGNTGFFISFIIIGAILGSVIGVFLAGAVPSLSILNKSLTNSIGFNIEIISFYLNLTPSAIIGLISGILIFIKI